LRASLLASLQLLQVPTADLHIPLVLVHALCEVARVDVARPRAVVVLRICRLRGVLLRLGLLLLLLLRGRRGAATSEEAADRVADRGSDCYTTVLNVSIAVGFVRISLWKRRDLRGCAGHLSEKTGALATLLCRGALLGRTGGGRWVCGGGSSGASLRVWWRDVWPGGCDGRAGRGPATGGSTRLTRHILFV